MGATTLLRVAVRASVPRRYLNTSPRNAHVPPPPISPMPWLFVGLGNPGEKYNSTRHNVGFEMVDAFAQSVGISMDSVHCKAFFGQGLVGGTPVLLAKPQTYMNLSGESVSACEDLFSGSGCPLFTPMYDFVRRSLHPFADIHFIFKGK